MGESQVSPTSPGVGRRSLDGERRVKSAQSRS